MGTCESNDLCQAPEKEDMNLAAPCLSKRDHNYNANNPNANDKHEGVTFVATSNAEALQPTEISDRSILPLSQVIKKSKAWVSSFPSTEEKQESDDEDIPSPAAQTIQGSWNAD